jgi:hypothetical protein
VYSDLFDEELIHYGAHATPHPLYPEASPKLRDADPTGFLFDILQYNKDHHVVFSVRIPSSSHIAKLALYDPRCEIVITQPPSSNGKGHHPSGVDWCREMYINEYDDYVWEVRKQSKVVRYLSLD